MGNALAGRLLLSLKAQRVTIRMNTTLQELIVEDGRVTGAVVSIDNKPQRITARRGVILATGGFGGSVERMNDYVMPPLNDAVAFAGARGDGIRIGNAAGAAIEDDHQSPVFWSPVSRTPGGSKADAAPIRILLDRAKPGLIAVNTGGPPLRRRGAVVSRLRRRHAPLARDRADDPGLARSCDSAFMHKYGLGRIPPGRQSFGWAVRNGYLVEARRWTRWPRPSASMPRA